MVTALFRDRGEELEFELLELTSFQSAFEQRQLARIREFDQGGWWRRSGATSCAAWVAWRLGLGHAAAAMKVRVALALGDLPLIDAEFARGVLSYSQVRAIIRVAVPGTQQLLLEVAKTSTAAQLEKLCTRVVQRLAADAGMCLEDALQLSFRTLDTGLVELSGTLLPEQAESFSQAISRAKEIAALDPADERASGEAAPRMSNVDALVYIAEHFVDSPPTALLPLLRRRIETVVLVDEKTLRSRGKTPVDTCELADGTQLATETARRLACDSIYVEVGVGSDGTPISAGRRTRRVSDKLMRLLHVRDRSCRFPGCANRAVLDAHHVKHWAHGGETTKENLVLLCRRHHRFVHEGGYRVIADGHGSFEFLDPGGQRVIRGTGAPEVTPVAWERMRRDPRNVGLGPPVDVRLARQQGGVGRWSLDRATAFVLERTPGTPWYRGGLTELGVAGLGEADPA